MLAQLTPPDLINISQLGVAGLMGALWWWERRYSRQREDQLTEAHNEILAQREHLQALLDALEGNTKVIGEFTAVQQEILRVMQSEGFTGPGPLPVAPSPPRPGSGS